MPSILTRQVFRRLLADQPLVYRGCLRRRVHTPATVRLHNPAPLLRPVHRSSPSISTLQRRSFFKLFESSKNDTKKARTDPGMDEMMQLDKLQRMRARLPPVHTIAGALDEFFDAKVAQLDQLEDNQADLALKSFKYCAGALEKEDVPSDSETKPAPRIATDTLLKAARAVRARASKDLSRAHVDLAAFVATQLDGRFPGSLDAGFLSYCSVLALSGSPQKAQEMLLQAESGLVGAGATTVPAADDGTPEQRETLSELHTVSGLDAAWMDIAKGFAVGNDEAQMLNALDLAKKHNLEGSFNLSDIALSFFIGRNDAVQIKTWWGRLFQDFLNDFDAGAATNERQEAFGDVLSRLAVWCAGQNEPELGHEVVRQVLTINPPKPAWDAIFTWALATGKGVDEIARMFGVMERANKSIQDQTAWRKPDTATINKLVKYAMSKKDPYMAERLISMGREHDIYPDRNTFVLQVDYRLGVNDLDGALTAYKLLQAEEVTTDDDVPVVNRLVERLCDSKQHDFETTMNIVADLTERGARLYAETVNALMMLHLRRDELHDVIDLLNTHAYQFSSIGRKVVRESLIKYTLDEANNATQAWNAYIILREIFNEMEREPRTQIMESFLKRRRADLAVHTFLHMRTHTRTDTIPTEETYVSAYLGIAVLRDEESLEVIHNQMKLDFNITVNTRVRNALIIAYTRCGHARQSLEFWDEIVASAEGPNYNSLHIALRACERSPFGDIKARQIWNRLRRLQVELDSKLWASYAAAIAGNDDHVEAMTILQEAEQNGELQIDAFVLGSLSHAVGDFEKAEDVEGWAKERYPSAWESLENLGYRQNDWGRKIFQIDRSVQP